MKRLHGLALLALCSCSSTPSGGAGGPAPLAEPYVVRGAVPVRDVPAGSRLVVVWVVKHGKPALTKFGEATPDDGAFELVFSTDPPARAVEPSGIATGLLVLLDDRVKVAADGDDFDAPSAEPHVLGSAEFHKLVWRGRGDAPVPEWAQAFPMGYSCGRCSGEAVGDRDEPVTVDRCDIVVTAETHAGACRIRPKAHRPGEPRSWFWPFPRGRGLALVAAGTAAIAAAPALVARMKRRRGRESSEPSLVRRYAPMLVVLGLALAWIAVAAISPDTMLWLHIHHAQKPAEGPFELVEEILLAVSVLAWAHVTWKAAGRWLRFALAAAMTLQMAVVLGEEVNWGYDMGWHLMRDLNLRMMIRHAHLLGPGPDAFVVTAFLLVFMGLPLVPVARVQRWLDRAAPVRARVEDTLALAAVPVVWLFIGGVLGAKPSIEFVHMGVYLVLGALTLRVWRQSRGARARQRGK